MPILSNLLIKVTNKQLEIGTDLEVELSTTILSNKDSEKGEITVPSRKFVDIYVVITEGSLINFSYEAEKSLSKAAEAVILYPHLLVNFLQSSKIRR